MASSGTFNSSISFSCSSRQLRWVPGRGSREDGAFLGTVTLRLLPCSRTCLRAVLLHGAGTSRAGVRHQRLGVLQMLP